jgi:phosphomannomutase / phosphoglucomutase
VRDIGPPSPMAYFAQMHLGAPAVAMVTASHNPNGWTGVKMGFEAPLTHGPDDMAACATSCSAARGRPRPRRLAGAAGRGVREAYLDDLAGDFRLSRRCAWSAPPATAPPAPSRPSSSSASASR